MNNIYMYKHMQSEGGSPWKNIDKHMQFEGASPWIILTSTYSLKVLVHE
jgi:hypothetical protein